EMLHSVCVDVLASLGDTPGDTPLGSEPGVTTDVAAERCIGPYEILDILGAGGFGRVYRAIHTVTGTAVALKTIVRHGARAVNAAIQREIRVLSALKHPGVVGILDEGIVDGHPWYAMELLEGTTLASHLSTRWSGDIVHSTRPVGLEPSPTIRPESSIPA